MIQKNYIHNNYQPIKTNVKTKKFLISKKRKLINLKNRDNLYNM